MKKKYETVFNHGEADRFGGQLTKICFVLIFLRLMERSDAGFALKLWRSSIASNNLPIK